MERKKTSQNLTEGNIVKQIIVFTIPILLGQLFQNLYHSVDSIVMGNFEGTTALAAVTASEDISNFLVGFFTGLSTGSGVLFSRYFGAGDHKGLHDAIHTAILFSGILGVGMAGIGIVAAPALLWLIDCPANVMEASLTYLRIYMVGVLFTSMYNVASGVLRAVGDSRRPFYYLVMSSCTNIVLDLLFVVVFHLGVMGVAAATVISQLLSCLLAFGNLTHTTDVYRLNLRELHINGKMLKEVMLLGLPAAIQSCMISFSNMFVQRYINGFGAAAMAGTGAAKKIDKYVGMISMSLGLTMSTFVGQNVGAKRYDRAFRSIRYVLVMGFATVAVLGTLIYFNADFCVGIFTKDPEAVHYGVLMVYVMMPMYYLQTLHQVFSNSVRGFGKSIVVMITTVAGLIVCRQLFLAVSMAMNLVIENVFWAYPVGWGCAAAFSMLYFLFAVYLPLRKEGKKA